MALPATAAHGQTTARHDPAHDVIRFRNSTDGSAVAAPHNKTADIVYVRYAHTNRRVTTTMRLRGYGGYWEYWEDIKTPTRKYLVFGDGRRAHHHFDLGTESGRVLTCDGLSATVHRATHTFRVAVPTTCLKQPRWVKAHLQYDVAALNPLNDDTFFDLNPRSQFTRRLYTG